MGKVSPKKWLFLNKVLDLKRCCFLVAVFLCPFHNFSQIANFVKNGGFEDKYDCNYPNVLSKAIGWNCVGTDTTKLGGELYAINCYSNAPDISGTGFQYPHSGNTFCRIQVFCMSPCAYYNSRIYPKNRLKSNLTSGRTYCVKMYLSLEEASPYAISDLSLCFADNSIDTINYCDRPLTYLIPQVNNPVNNIIIDTLNWVLVTGTFVATGTEKYLVIGNFVTNQAVTKSPAYGDTSVTWSEYFLDDVSCIDIDLPAFACANTNTYVIPGESVFLGRQPDVGIDEDCMWYKLPNMTTAIDTVAGFWAKPVVTTTYIVRQEICGNVKWDTVVVAISALGIQDLRFKIQSLQVYPIPAQDELKLQWSLEGPEKEFTKAEILNNLGQVVEEVDLTYVNKQAVIDIKDLSEGVYVITLRQAPGDGAGTVSKRFVVSR